MIRFAAVALLLPACALPLDLAPRVTFQAEDSALLLAAEAGAEQFAAVYPSDIEVTTPADAPKARDVRNVSIQLVAPGFLTPGSDEPMCQWGARGTARISGRAHGDNIWICNDMPEAKTKVVLIHEMCHTFGSPGYPHWPGEGGACTGRDDTGVISKFEKQEFQLMWKGM